PLPPDRPEDRRPRVEDRERVAGSPVLPRRAADRLGPANPRRVDADPGLPRDGGGNRAAPAVLDGRGPPAGLPAAVRLPGPGRLAAPGHTAPPPACSPARTARRAPVGHLPVHQPDLPAAPGVDP